MRLPCTGSTAIARTLIDHYGGKKILHKHAIYYEFMHAFRRQHLDYFVIGGVRSPLETRITEYSKLERNHKQRFSSGARRQWWSVTKRHLAKFEDVQGGMDFSSFFLKYQTRPFHNFYLLGHDHFNATIRHEALQRDFEHAMNTAGIDNVVNVPVVNRIEDKRSVDDAYDAVARRRAIKMFGPFMSEWGYEFSSSWKSLLTDSDREQMAANAKKYRRVEYVAEVLSRRFGLSPNGSGRTVQQFRNLMRPIFG